MAPIELARYSLLDSPPWGMGAAKIVVVLALAELAAPVFLDMTKRIRRAGNTALELSSTILIRRHWQLTSRVGVSAGDRSANTTFGGLALSYRR